MPQQDLLSTLRHLISGIDESLVIFDNRGRILHASYGLRKLFGEEELEGKSIYQFVEKSEYEIRSFLEHLNLASFKDVQVNMLRLGKVFPVRLRLAAWCVAENEHVALASLVDATTIERKKRDLLRKTLTIEQLSKSRKIRSGKLHDAIYEILEMSSKAVTTTRVNAWLFNEDATTIECIGNYDARVNDMVAQDMLPVFDKPNYFKLFETEKIIIASDAQHSSATSELNDSYLIPNNIQSLMDIPLRIEGEFIGVICFEEVGSKRIWSLQDQKFGLIASQMVSLAYETFNRKIVQQKLESALRQQRRLMAESNHRIKNNLTITLSLLRLQMNKCKDDYHRNLLQDSVNRVNSIASLHELLAQNNTTHRVHFEQYARQLIDSLKESFFDSGKDIQLIASFDACELSGSLAITLGLIINEAVTNAYKHAFQDQESGVVRIDFKLQGNKGHLEISDSGKGMSEAMITEGEGFDIIRGMADHLDAELRIDGKTGLTIDLIFKLS